MKITPPSHYSPVTKPVCFEFDCGERSSFEVDIIDDATDAVIGRKSFVDVVQGSIDIVPYIYRDFEVEPILSQNCLIQNSLQRSYHIEIGDIVSPSVRLSSNRRPLPQLPLLLTQMPLTRTMASNECDQLLLFVDSNDSITVDCVASTGENVQLEMSSSSGVVDIVVTAAEFSDDVQSLEIFIVAGSHHFEPITYTIRNHYGESRRIAWYSSLGTIEAYSFPIIASSYRTAERNTYRTAEGGTRTATMMWRRGERLVSDYECRSTLCSLADIVSNGEAWIVTPNGLQPTMVEDRTMEAYQMGEVGYLQVEIVTDEEEVALC